MDRIQDHAIIGDCRSAALISRSGALDWLCWPRFESPPIFAGLLDERAGSWRISPTTPFESRQEYLENTNLLQTHFTTATGKVTVTDLMPVMTEGEKHQLLVPEHEILRRVECVEGEVEMEMCFAPRPDFGQGHARIRSAGRLGLRVEIGAGVLILRTDGPCSISEERTVRARARLRQGDCYHCSLTYTQDSLAIIRPLGEWSQHIIARSIAWWHAWASKVTYRGPARGAVIRSALALKLLIYAPSGAVVAAPTTSLPERLGGDLNWDYRFCWLRDASFTARALLGLGYGEEAEAFMSWLLHATRLTQPALRVLYDVYGRQPSDERVVEGLKGYRGSRPVRVGNAACEQLQLDVYGEVIDAAAQFIRRGRRLDRDTERMLCAFGAYVCRHWQEPDEGIWEPRSGRHRNTHSLLLCWTALQRLLELAAEGVLTRAPTAEFARVRDAMRRALEGRAWNPRLQCYVSQLDGELVDASLLLLPWYGFEPADSPRMKSTYARIRARLGTSDGLLYRYRTGESPGEGAFGICGFWGAEYLALGGGTAKEAEALFERLCADGNDAGLFAEEIEPRTGEPLGNFPQAFTHVGLINAALSVSRRLAGEQPRAKVAAGRRQPPAERGEVRA